jgi:hypothetical protein
MAHHDPAGPTHSKKLGTNAKSRLTKILLGTLGVSAVKGFAENERGGAPLFFTGDQFKITHIHPVFPA